MSNLIILVVAHYSNNDLDFNRIFSTLEIMASFQLSVFIFSLGLGFYYEVDVVLSRFASVFNIEDTCMIKIDPKTN